MKPSDLPRRVVVTGMGVMTALGSEPAILWQNLLDGKCGIRRLAYLTDDSPLPTKYAGWIDDEAVLEAINRYDITDPDRTMQMGLYVAGRALEEADLPTDGKVPLEIDVIAGTGHGNITFHNDAVRAYVQGGYRKIRPTSVIRLMFNRLANMASIRYKLTGVGTTVSCACATGSLALGTAFHHVRFGTIEQALAVCADSGLDPITFAGWNRLGVFSKNPDPRKASRPFDKDRDGLVMGEGAAAFLIETLESAHKRRARVLAEIIGYGTSSDAAHMVVPEVCGQVAAIRKALHCAGVEPRQIDFVNAHGTSTVPADKVEAASLIQALGERGKTVPVANTKAQLGHLMGATAAVELVITLIALQKGLIPPCRNLENPDPECPLSFVRGQPLECRINVALKNSFAFGGTNAVLVFKRFDGDSN